MNSGFRIRVQLSERNVVGLNTTGDIREPYFCYNLNDETISHSKDFHPLLSILIRS